MVINNQYNSIDPYNNKSWWQRARQSRLGIACVVALTLFTDMLVYGVVIPCLPMLVIDRLHGDSTMVGFLFGCYAFGLLLATPVFAILSDRYQNRRYPTMVGMIGLGVSTMAFAVADSYVLLVLARVAQGVAGGASWTIGLGMLADVFPTKRLGMVMGSVMTAHTVGFAVGPAIGGLLYEYGGFGAPFHFCAGFAVLNFLAVVWIEEPLVLAKQLKQEEARQHVDEAASFLLPEDDGLSCYSSIHSTMSTTTNYTTTPSAVFAAIEDPSLAVKQSQQTEQKEHHITMWSLLHHWRILSCVLCVVVSASVFSGIEPALPVHLQETYGCSASTIGFIFVTMVVPAFLAPLIGHLSDTIGRQVISSTGMVMMAVVSPLVALRFSSVYMIIPPLMLFGLSSPVTLTPVLPEMGEIVSDMGGDAYAQVYALYNMAYASGMFIGPVFAGYIMSNQGFETLMVLFSIGLLVCSPVMVDWLAVWRRCVAYCRRYRAWSSTW
ncbi:major facilitator superfamily domain-containing protein [Chlamydoabsidia padenii]|nr:major facilitator superfamily domain-containing protein [Chlamydoabsidia padenii]